MKGKIRIRLRSFDPAMLDVSAKRIVMTAQTTGVEIHGPIPLPNSRVLYSVIRGPHIDKRSQEQFELVNHCRLIEIHRPNEETIERLSKLDLHAGVEVEIKVI